MVWEKGRQLKSFGSNVYTYNASGIRTSKTVNGVKHTYTLDGARILREQWVEGEDINREIIPLYDNEDNVCGILHCDIPYYFLKNLQGDVIAITNQRGETVARYTYDAWGACTISYDATATPTVEGGEAINIATVNPFRYRSYYFDTETGLYYLQSRYYDPALGRFINVDSCFAWDIEKNVFTTNGYHYCQNDPVNQLDTTGKAVLQIVIRAIIGAIFGAAMQYLGDVLQNLVDCVIDNKKVTKKIWKVRSSIWDYMAAIVTGACDATLKIGVWKSIGISIVVTLVNHLMNWVSGRGFSFQQLIKDLVWNALLSIVSNAIGKRFMPKQGKTLNKSIRRQFKVKGTQAYARIWSRMCECIEWNTYVISTFINSLRSACRRILDFVEVILWDCMIKAFDKLF